MDKQERIINTLRVLIDEMEKLYGELEGFEIRLEHPIVEGKRQAFADIKEFTVVHLHKTQIDI